MTQSTCERHETSSVPTSRLPSITNRTVWVTHNRMVAKTDSIIIVVVSFLPRYVAESAELHVVRIGRTDGLFAEPGLGEHHELLGKIALHQT